MRKLDLYFAYCEWMDSILLQKALDVWRYVLNSLFSLLLETSPQTATNITLSCY